MLKISAIITTIALTCITSITVNIAHHPSVLAQSLSRGKLTRSQIQKLQSLGIKIAVPTYIPSGFRVAAVEIKPCPAGQKPPCRFGPSYKIVYRNANNLAFSIESASGGFGGLEPEYKLPINSPVFGSSYLYYGYFQGRNGPDRSLGKVMYSEWLQGDRQYYRFYNINSNITPEAAVKITESLDYL